jgi:hypothetical protein
MSTFGHGAVGTREQEFTTLLPLRTAGYPPHLLAELAASIKAEKDGVKGSVAKNEWERRLGFERSEAMV